MYSTITAISSGNINQPISIIRLSGSESFDIVKKIFKGKVGKHRTITYGNIVENDTLVDEVLISWFRGPNSFTGEDIVEIQAHGGVINTNKILKLLLVNGAEMAEPGEFSRRAFLNGKMDLTKAEGIHDLIFAKTDEQAKLAANAFTGKTYQFIEAFKNKILNIIAICETNIDYPEYEDIETLNSDNILPKLEDLKNDINKVIDTTNSNKHIFNGIKVAIVGKTNVGKSTLFNNIINESRAIVTDVRGTTRDVIEKEFIINGVPFSFMDTAGIRETSDTVEGIGIEKSYSAINGADCVIHLVSIDQPWNEDDDKIKNAVSKNQLYIEVGSKYENLDLDNTSINQNDISQLLDKLKNEYPKINIQDNFLSNTRQLALLEKAILSLDNAISASKMSVDPSITILDIRETWEHVSNITGNASNEKLLDAMFKNFCLGK